MSPGAPRDRQRLLGLLGRVGVITQGEYRDRLILFYAEPTPGYWTGVVSSSPEEGPLDFFIIADEYAANVIEEYGIVWLARSVEEAVVEEMVFDCRGTFKTPRRTINRWISDVLGRRSTEPRSSS